MKIFLVIALIPLLLTGQTDSKRLLEAISQDIGNASKTSSTKNTFNTLVKNTKTTYSKINAKTVEVIVPITSDLEIKSVNLYNNALELSILTTNDTMITSIETIVTTSSTSSLTTMEVDVITSAISTLGESLTKKHSAAPVETLKLEIVLATSDISFGNIITSNVTTVEAVAATCSKIQNIETNSQTKKGMTILIIDLTSTDSCESSSPSTASTSTHTTGTSLSPFSADGLETTPIKGQSTTTIGTKIVSTSTKSKTNTAESIGTDITPTSSLPNITTSVVSTPELRTTVTHESTTQVQTDTTYTTALPMLSTSEQTYSNSSSSGPNLTTIDVSTSHWRTTSNQTKFTNISSTPILSTSERTRPNSTSSAPNVTTKGLTTPYWHSTVTPTAGSCDREYSCVNCTTARVCAPTDGGQDLREVARFSCPDYAPWCDSHSGTCSRARSPECDLPVVGSLTCMRDGHFPDPYSCSDYFVCDDDVPLQFTCLYPSPYYSSVTRSCGNSSSDCVDYVSLCKDKSGLKVAVPTVHNLFLYCVRGAVEVVDRCIGAYLFDFEQQQCVPECPHEGLFPRDDDCAGYYRCSPSPEGDTYVMTNLTCPQGKAFSESAYDCIDRSLVHNCNVTYISLS